MLAQSSGEQAVHGVVCEGIDAGVFELGFDLEAHPVRLAEHSQRKMSAPRIAARLFVAMGSAHQRSESGDLT